MAVTKNMAYDNAAYLAVIPVNMGSITGASGQGARFAAFTQILVKSIQVKATTAGTSNTIVSLLSVSGTTTTTTALATIGSGVTTTTNVLSTLTLAAGDVCWVQNGTDATVALASGAEMVLVPGASVTP